MSVMGFITNRRDYEARKLNLKRDRDFWKERIKAAKKDEDLYALPEDKPLSKEQKEEIDKFWEKYEFVDQVDYKAFQTYYNRSGIFDPRYVPYYMVKLFIRPNTAPPKYMAPFQNKAYLPSLLFNVKQPETIVRKTQRPGRR